MHNNYSTSYRAPQVEVVEVTPQQGFAASGSKMDLDVTPGFFEEETDW